MDLMEMKLGAARSEALYNTKLMAAFEKHNAAKAALMKARRYAKQCKIEVRTAIADKAKAVEIAKALGVSLVGDGDSSEKVGAGGTAVCSSCGRQRPQALVYRGHDMESTIGVGDKVYYDSEIQVIDGDGLYALKPVGVVIVRRLVAESGGRVSVVCDSPNKALYPDQIYMADELHLLNIVGKVIGWKMKGVTLPAD